MRVRQLETIREFLKRLAFGAGGLVFTIVFLVAMWIYSVKLFLISVSPSRRISPWLF
jgi:subfamily B ATP-binding cassette protein HlyB/CyaB